jgi:hypothetical protein
MEKKVFFDCKKRSGSQSSRSQSGLGNIFESQIQMIFTARSGSDAEPQGRSKDRQSVARLSEFSRKGG